MEVDCKSTGSAYVGSNPTLPIRSNSSAVEHLLYTEIVGGSIPSSSILQYNAMNYVEQCSNIIGNHDISFVEDDIINFIKMRRRWPHGTLSVINYSRGNSNIVYESDGFLNYPKVKKLYDLGFTIQAPHVLDLTEGLRELNDKLYTVRGCETVGNFYFSKGTSNLPSFSPHTHGYCVVVKPIYGQAEWLVGEDTFIAGPSDVILIPAECPHAVVTGEEPRLSITFNLDE